MGMESLLVVVCASALLAVEPSTTTPAPAADQEVSVSALLGVQTAMQRARDALFHNNPHEAVEILEKHLARINGNPAYLSLLRDAYRAYVKSLRLTNQESLAQVYQQRLLILEPGPSKEITNRAASGYARPATASAAAEKSPVGTPVVRAMREEEDPFQQARLSESMHGRVLLAEAEEYFKQGRFHDANVLYQKAQKTDQTSTSSAQDHWAYCKIHDVLDQLNQHSSAYAAMETEVRTALNLKPSAGVDAYGKQLLAEIETRRSRSAKTFLHPEDDPAFLVRDLGRTPEGWSVAETANFRILHNLPPDWVRKTAQIAERTRMDMQRKWFGATESWSPKCDIYMHATADDYSRMTGVPASSPGHSSFNFDASRVLTRRIDLHCDDPGFLVGVLPHETTHVVLAGKFGDKPVPRWADEGVAVLTEPRDKIERHLRNLPRHRQDGELLPLRRLVQMSDYPEPRYIGAFYAESVSLVEFLSKERGPEVFTQFVRDGMRYGYESALKKYYGYGFDELEMRWQSYAFGDATRPGTGIARGSR